MKKYLVTVPITGYAVVTVEAENEDEAKQKVLDNDALVTIDDIDEWQTHEIVCKGGVLYAVQNEIDAIEAFHNET